MNRVNVFLKVLFLAIYFFFVEKNIFAQSDSTVRIHILSDIRTLIPFNATGADEISIDNQIFETLLRMNPQTLEPDIPSLAESLPLGYNLAWWIPRK